MANLVEDFVKATINIPSPPHFRRWCGISMVGGVMGRRVWTMTIPGLPVFANLFVMLVGPPSVGKTLPMLAARELLETVVDDEKTPCIAFSMDEVTREKLIEHMGKVFTEMRTAGSRSYIALISDFGTFMPEPDTKLLQGLSDIWDCRSKFEKGTKKCGDDLLWQPYVNLLAGAQPAWFEQGFPKASYEMGMPSRTFFIYCSKEEAEDPNFFKKGEQVEHRQKFEGKLQEIQARWRGLVEFDPAAQRAWLEWHAAGMPPEPTDPLLLGYCGRRAHHAAKLTLIAAASRHPTKLTITPEDLAQAQEWMFGAEERMPEALVAAGGNVYLTREMAVLEYVRAEFLRTRRPVAEREIRRRLGMTVSTPMVGTLIDEMIKQGKLKLKPSPDPEDTKRRGNRLLSPGGV